MGVLGHMKSSKPVINNINLCLVNQLLFRKQLLKNTKSNIQPKRQYKCNKCDNPYFKKGHNISKNITKKEFMEISTNIESDNNDKTNEVDKLSVEHAKDQE